MAAMTRLPRDLVPVVMSVAFLYIVVRTCGPISAADLTALTELLSPPGRPVLDNVASDKRGQL